MKIALGIFLGILFPAFIFCSFAFGNFKINPEYWNTDSRGICAFIMGVASIAGFFIGKDGNIKN